MDKATMVRVFAPGSRIEIDYADGINLMDVATGEITKTELFVGVLACSRYSYAEFTLTQSSEDFLSSHIRMFEYFGGVAQSIAPDNLKSAVTKAHRYDPVINPAYTRLAGHYGFAVVPARVRRPQDKAIVERTIQIFQRWFYFRVRHQRFASLVELNSVLRKYLEIFHDKRHRIFKKTRLELFLMEKEHLNPLPLKSYCVSVYRKALLSRDCHFVFEGNYYSAPHGLRGKYLDLWVSAKTIEIYDNGERVALHSRARKDKGKFVTDRNHYPAQSIAYLEEDVTKLRNWAERIGPETKKLVESLLGGPHPLQFLRRAQGILSLSQRHSYEALENAAKTANLFEQTTYGYIKRVIKHHAAHGQPLSSLKRGENPHLRGLERILH